MFSQASAQFLLELAASANFPPEPKALTQVFSPELRSDRTSPKKNAQKQRQGFLIDY
jgi:hypothetical protein